MTKSTWNRIERLDQAAVNFQDSFQSEKEQKVSECIYRMFLRAGIDPYPLEWDGVCISFDTGIIETWDITGKIIQTFNVFTKANPKVA